MHLAVEEDESAVASMSSKRGAPEVVEYTLSAALISRDPLVKAPRSLDTSSILSQLSSLLNHLLRPELLQLISAQADAQKNIRAVFATDLESLGSNLRSETAMIAFEATHSVEVVFDLYLEDSSQAQTNPKPRFGLALFDMDSTLIQQEVIDELARSVGLFPAVSAITARAMNGELDFEASLRERVALLRGVKVSIWDELKLEGRITITEGAKKLVQRLRELGAKTAVASGGFLPMAEWLKGELGLDHAFANHLETSGPTADFPYEHLTGKLQPEHPIITPEEKRAILYRLAKEHGVPLSRTLVVGDGSNDLLMMHAAGLGVAWNAKERVQREAPNRLNGHSLAELCFLVEKI